MIERRNDKVYPGNCFEILDIVLKQHYMCVILKFIVRLFCAKTNKEDKPGTGDRQVIDIQGLSYACSIYLLNLVSCVFDQTDK